MSSNSDAGITLVARTDEFEAKLKQAIGTFESLSSKGVEVARSTDQSFKKISLVTKNSVRDIERSFNSLSIKSDFSLSVQAKALEANARFFKQQYANIKADGQSSAADITRAYAAMNTKLSQLAQQPTAGAFKTLGILPTATIAADKAKILKAYSDIKRSGVSSAKDIETAHTAMQRKMRQMDGVVDTNTKKMNLFGLASVATILKIQVLFSLVNQTMSAIGAIPGIAFSAVEDFNASSVAGAAILTSMQKSTRDIGVRYQENLGYSKQVNQELIRMDAHTAASFRNLSDMNTQFRNQGILIDTNNKKQVDGFVNIANALAVLTAGSTNQALQYTQEVKALLKGEQRPGNLLFDLMNTLDNGNLKETLKTWQQISKETGNAGFAIEQMGNMLVGFKAAQGDIDALWSTVKSTMETIRDEILRDGFGPMFEIIVGKMNELNQLAKANKVEIARMMQSGFAKATSVVTTLWKITKAITFIAEPAIWLAIGGGIVAATTATIAWASAITVASGGINLLLAGLAGVGVYVAKDAISASIFSKRAAGISTQEGFTSESLEAILAKYPLATDEQIREWMRMGAIQVLEVGKTLLYETPLYETNINQEHIDWLKAVGQPKGFGVPEGITGKGTDDEAALSKLVNLQERLGKRLLDVRKSNAQLMFAETKAIDAKELATVESKYAALELSTKDYLDRKAELAVKAAKDEIKVKEDLLLAAQMAEIKLAPPLVGTDKEVVLVYLAKQAELTSNINKAKKALVASESKLATLTIKNTSESNTLLRTQAQLVRDIRKAELEMSLQMIPAKEQLGELTSVEATNQTISLLQEKLDIQQQELLLNKQLGDSEQKRYQQQLAGIQEVKLAMEEQTKILYDQTTIGSMELAFKQYTDSVMSNGEKVGNMISTTFSSMENALTKFVTTGKLDFKSLATSIIADMLRIEARQQVSSILSTLGGALKNVASAYFAPSFNSPASAATGNYGPVQLSAKGNVFNSPGLSAHSNSIVSTPTLFPFANGAGLMGEAGPEAILPLERNSQGKLGVVSSGGGLNIQINNYGKEKVETKEATTASGGKSILIQIGEAVAGDIRNGGPVASAISGTFNIRPKLAYR